MLKARLVVALALVSVVTIFPAAAALAQAPVVWVRSYPQQITAQCTYYVAEWSDGTFSQTPWQCNPGYRAQIVTRLPDGTVTKTITADPAYTQQNPNGCTELVTPWDDGSFSIVPVSCPPGAVYIKPPQSQAPLDVNAPSAPRAAITSVTGGRIGEAASVTATTNPNVTCSLTFRAADGSEPWAFPPQSADNDGNVTWTWLVPAGTPLGVGQVTVACVGITASADLLIQ